MWRWIFNVWAKLALASVFDVCVWMCKDLSEHTRSFWKVRDSMRSSIWILDWHDQGVTLSGLEVYWDRRSMVWDIWGIAGWRILRWYWSRLVARWLEVCKWLLKVAWGKSRDRRMRSIEPMRTTANGGGPCMWRGGRMTCGGVDCLSAFEGSSNLIRDSGGQS